MLPLVMQGWMSTGTTATLPGTSSTKEQNIKLLANGKAANAFAQEHM